MTTGHYDEHDTQSRRGIVWFAEPVRVYEDVWIGAFDGKISEHLLRSCMERGYNWEPQLLFFSPYSFYRVHAPIQDGNELHFDPDHLLYRTVAMSRLVHPTSAGLEYAVRVRRQPDDSYQAIPVRFTHINPSSYVVDTNEDWLIPSDVPQLTSLLAAYFENSPCDRVQSALFYFEAAAHNYYFDVAWPILSTSLEALIRITDERRRNGHFAGSMKVFVDRLLAIGSIDPALAVPESDLRKMYQHRSALVHGLGAPVFGPEVKTMLRRKLDLARAILRKALLDPSFDAIFRSDAALQSALPLRP